MNNFWVGIIKMWAKRHGIKELSLQWVTAAIIFLLGLLGIFTTHGILLLISKIGALLALLFELWSFFIELPAKKWKEDTEAFFNILNFQRQTLGQCLYFHISNVDYSHI